jgi:hypothetical protein
MTRSPPALKFSSARTLPGQRRSALLPDSARGSVASRRTAPQPAHAIRGDRGHLIGPSPRHAHLGAVVERALRRIEAVRCTIDQTGQVGWNTRSPRSRSGRDLSRTVAGGGGSISNLTGACPAAITPCVEAEQPSAAVAVVAAESARTQTAIERPVLGNPVICTRDCRRRRAALELRALAGSRARATKRNASVWVCLRMGQLASGQEGDRCSECAEKVSSWRGTDGESCQMVEG